MQQILIFSFQVVLWWIFQWNKPNQKCWMLLKERKIQPKIYHLFSKTQSKIVIKTQRSRYESLFSMHCWNVYFFLNIKQSLQRYACFTVKLIILKKFEEYGMIKILAEILTARLGKVVAIVVQYYRICLVISKFLWFIGRRRSILSMTPLNIPKIKPPC